MTANLEFGLEAVVLLRATMMSAGNPFRRSRVPVEPDPASANIFASGRGVSEEAAASKIACISYLLWCRAGCEVD